MTHARPHPLLASLVAAARCGSMVDPQRRSPRARSADFTAPSTVVIHTHGKLLAASFASMLVAIGCGPAGPPSDAGPSLDGACPAGSGDCACLSDGSCGAGLRCDRDTERCEVCPRAEEGCACAVDGSCGAGLECGPADTCVIATCEDGALGCACRASDRECDGSAVCSSAGTCVACAADVVRCPCADGACGSGLVCDSMSERCRNPLSCEDLRVAGRCDPAQICEESADGGDASCLPGSCVDEFRWSSELGACVPCTSPGCESEPSCDEEAPGSIVTECASEERECSVDVDGIGRCGGCVAGFADIGGECRRQIDCGGRACEADEYCDASAAGGPGCVPRPCTDPSAVVDPVSGTCSITCTVDCSIEGSTGRYWPFADREGNCICETLPGYFFDNGGEIGPVLCDADRDGWVRDDVRAPNMSGATADPALAANVRCTIRAVDRVELRDEYGRSSVITSCDDEGLLQDATEACTPLPLRLLESRRNDVPGEAARLGEALPYSFGGRRLHANELNALTKACVGLIGDYDDDGTDDIGQVQSMPMDTSMLDEVSRLRSFAHFVELYRTTYAPPAGGEVYGMLVIEERSRCDDSTFPLRYGADTVFDVDDPSSYWRNCERRRDPGFDANMPESGSDFAQWSCSSRSGTCGAPEVPAHPTTAAAPGPGDALVRGHGLCNLGTAAPADLRWRGMHHHSQFQCVQVVADMPGPRDRTLASFGASGDLTFNACRVLDCAGAAECPDSTSLGSGGFDPRLTCATLHPPDVGDVGWAAVRYRPYGHRTGADPMGTELGEQRYRGGCVNEDAEWSFLCPAPDFGRCGGAPTDAFGRYRCHGWGDTCPTPPNASTVCPSSTCDYTCDGGFDDCNGAAMDGCEAELASNVDNCGICGAACSVPNATPTCTSSTCQVSSCNSSWYDVNAMPGDGCECQDDAHSASCGGATSVGSIGIGDVERRSGKIVPGGASDWFTVTFTSAASGAGGGTPSISFASNPTDAENPDGLFRFGVLGVCGGSSLSCDDRAGGASELTSYSLRDDQSDPGPNQWSTRDVPWPTTVYVDVHRVTTGLSCADYTIQFSL